VNVIAATLPSVTCSAGGKSSIAHVVIIEKENHSWDSIFGKYCTGSIGSTSGNYGPSACEAAPATVSGKSPITLTDAQNLAYDPPHSQSSEICMIDWGHMDGYVTGSCSGASPSNFAIMNTSGDGAFYGQLARSQIPNLGVMNSATGDHFFQASQGASSMNDMYLALPHFLFLDNNFVPQNSSLNGARCYSSGFVTYTAPTIYDLLNSCSVSWSMYADGWNQNPTHRQCYPSYFDASDFGEAYFSSLTTNPGRNWRDSSQFATDVSSGSLPAVSHVRARGSASEHPGISSITASTTFISQIIGYISGSSTYKTNTLIVILDDESGGFYDHVSPPGLSPIDGQFYGPRVAFGALGYAVKAPNANGGYISHQQMEMSSILKFLEWNFF